MEKIKIASLFAGCGGTDLGFEGGFIFLGKRYPKNPIEIVYANEFDQGIAKIFDANFRVKCDVRDIRKIPATQIPDHDILTGGFPCQSFSIVAQNPPRLGCKDEKGQLFFEMCRILRVRKPTAFVAENVKGILSANNYNAFPLIIEEFEKCGYIVSSQVLNAADYGIPQKRERVFIVGIRKDIGKKFYSPEPTHGKEENLLVKKWEPLRKVIFPHDEVNNKYFFSDKAHEGLKKSNPSMNKGRAQDVASACNTVGAHLAKVSLNSTDPVLKVNGRFRRFAPREVARIQSFPDRFKLLGPETIQYKALGNAIPPVLVWHVTKRLIEILVQGVKKDVRTKREIRSYNMSQIRSKNTSIEKILSKELRVEKIKHRKHVKELPGIPDFILKDGKVAVFCDSSYWHGKDYPSCIERIKTNKDFWKKKIENNITRDKKVNKELKKKGWKVLRFWDEDIEKNIEKVIYRIKSALR